MIRRIFTLLGLCTLLAIGPVLAVADEVPVDGSEPIVAPSETDKWWGALGGVVCGYGIRLAIYNPVVGMNPYVLAATIGGASSPRSTSPASRGPPSHAALRLCCRR